MIWGHDSKAELREQIGLAKQRLPLSQLIELLGDDALVDENKCPFHEDMSPSFSTWETYEGQELWKCHAGCGSGDEIIYLEIKYGLSRWDALEMYLEEAGVIHQGGGWIDG